MMKRKVLFPVKCIFVLALVLLFGTPAFALTPEIHSIEPDHGPSSSPTNVTIYGANFEAIPKAALYGGEPTIVGSADTPDWAWGVFVSTNYAYVADRDSGLQVIDIVDPTNPTIVGSEDTPSEAQDVYVSGNYAYVADGYSGLQVVDVSDPTNPAIVGATDMDHDAQGVYVSGNYAYLADGSSGLQVIDISDPANPNIVGSVEVPNWATGVYVSDNHAYVTAGLYGGLQIIDVSDPTNPTIVGSVDTPSEAQDVYLLGNYAYVADFLSGLQVIDVSDPTNPTITGSVDTPYFAWGVYVSGNYAYVADAQSGLQVIDIVDPTNPTIVGSEDTPSRAQDVYVSGNYAYVADGYSGLQVLKAFEPCTNVTFVDSTTLTATVPAGLPLGTHNLNVVNPNGERAILHNSFTVTEPDITSPSVKHTGTNPGPPKFYEVTCQDLESGLAEINVVAAKNFTVDIPPFDVGANDPVILTVTKVDQSKSSFFDVEVIDVAGNVTRFDPEDDPETGELKSSGGSSSILGCFIATAVYGSALVPTLASLLLIIPGLVYVVTLKRRYSK